MAIASINPATGEKLKEFKAHNDAEIEKRLKCAEQAFQHHRRESFPKRAQLMIAAATLLEREKEELARTMTLEMGKLFRASVEEIEKCERGCRYYAENAERFLEDEVAQTNARRSYVHYEPIGPVLAIMPWNFPFLAGLSICRARAHGWQTSAFSNTRPTSRNARWRLSNCFVAPDSTKELFKRC